MIFSIVFLLISSMLINLYKCMVELIGNAFYLFWYLIYTLISFCRNLFLLLNLLGKLQLWCRSSLSLGNEITYSYSTLLNMFYSLLDLYQERVITLLTVTCPELWCVTCLIYVVTIILVYSYGIWNLSSNSCS